MKNSEPNSLARIPLRWMIRETFNTNTGIIFDACMLRREVGLDMDQEMGKDVVPTLSPPDPLPPSGDCSALARPSKGEFEGYSFRRFPVAIISGLTSPFRWVGRGLHKLCTRDFGDDTDIPTRSERKVPSEIEANEERKDALSPIFDEMRIHPWWKVLEFLPCKFCPMASSEGRAHAPLKGSSKGKETKTLTTAGRIIRCKPPHLITSDGQHR